MRRHSNPNWQLVLVQGKDHHFQRGETRLVLQQGHVLLLHPNEVHTSWGREPTDSGFFYAQFSMDEDQEAQGGDQGQRIPLYSLAWYPASDVFELFAELVQEMQERPAYYRVRSAGLLTEIIVRLARGATPLGSDFRPLRIRSPHEAKIVDQLKRFLEAHYRERLTAQVISDSLGYSYAYLSRVFSRATGMTITDYIHYLRVEEARVLLLEMNDYQSIQDIAASVGYTDPSYFARVFRKREGVSPRTYVQTAYGRLSRDPAPEENTS